MTMQITREAIVIGGGLAGSTAAIALARAGRDVLLLEKSRGAHHKVCGEFLSHEAVHYLTQLGADLRALGAVPITGVRLAANTLVAESTLPFSAMSLTRRALDEALLQRAADAGVEVLRGEAVTQLAGHADDWTVQATREHRSRNILLATGKHDLREWNRGPGKQSNLVGFKMYFRLQPQQAAALASFVELVLFPGGYAGLQPVEEGMANLCLLVTRDRLQSLSGAWPNLLQHMTRHSSHLAERLNGAAPLLEKPLALSSIPYGYLAPQTDEGVWRLGDQMAVIPSFSGDGMSIALHSAHLAARMYLAGESAEAYRQRAAKELTLGVRTATAISQGLVRAPWLAAAAALWPGLLRAVAVGTRVPSENLLHDPASFSPRVTVR